MNVTVSDPDGEDVDVGFYWSNHTLIYELQDVANNSVASILLQDNISGYQLEHNTDYNWYVNVSDGSEYALSPVFPFHTSMAPDINEDRTVNYLDVSLLVSHYAEAVSPPGSSGWDINNDGNTNYLDVSSLVSAYGDSY